MEVKRMSLTDVRDFKDLILGIDLGTTNSAVAVYGSTAVPSLCPMGDDGKYTLQSCVRWDGENWDDTMLFTVGPEAYAERFKPNVIYSVKRMMGSGQNVVLTLRTEPPYPKPGDKEWDASLDLELTPAEVSAEILKALKAKAQESYPGVYQCIITVPAYFNQRQIEDTLQAAKLAGLDCKQILKEPTSASYIYSLLGYARDGSVLVYDLGGGTFDVTHMMFMRRDVIPKTLLTSLKRQYGIESDIASSVDSSPYYCRVLGTYGDTRLGGDDIDAEFARLTLKQKDAPKLTDDEFEELILRCEQFKKNNYVGSEIKVNGKSISLNQSVLEQATRTIFNRTLEILSAIPKEELDAVSTIVLVGGATKSDYLVGLIENAFHDKEISRVLDPDATVALGAGALAKDLQAGKEPMYQDVLPLPIGILVNEEEIEVCISKNTAMPYSVTKEFCTLHDHQEAIRIDLYQGLSKRPDECTYLGYLRMTGFPDKPAGEVKVKVSFILSAQGRLRVSTKVSGVEDVKELVIDSIFNVTANVDDGSNMPGVTSEFGYDDFEIGIADLIGDNYAVQTLVYERRAALEKGDATKASSLEERILSEL